jgi:hypothetical protein
MGVIVIVGRMVVVVVLAAVTVVLPLVLDVPRVLVVVTKIDGKLRRLQQ